MNTATTPSPSAIPDIHRLARRRVKARLGWVIHATVYLVVTLGMFALSFGSGRPWAIYPALGWGLGLLLHGLSVWLFAPGGSLLENMVARERARLTQASADRR